MVDDELWIGTYTSGVVVLNVEKGTLNQYRQSADPHSLDNSSSYAIYNDRRGRIWVATMTGLNRYDRAQDNFERVGAVDDLIIDIDEDNDGCGCRHKVADCGNTSSKIRNSLPTVMTTMISCHYQMVR